MQSNPKIDRINAPLDGGAGLIDAADPHTARRRWRMLLLTFLITSVLGLSYVWLRAPVYQSYAILHLSYSQSDLEAIAGIANEHLSIHHQRLTSPRILGLVAQQLADQRQIQLSPSRLTKILKATPITDSRLLKLTATDTAPEILLPIVETWVDLYLELQATEQKASASDEALELQAKLAEIETRITDRRQKLADFTAEHEIVSLERDESSVLNEIKGLGAALDAATEEKATATATLRAIESAIASNQVMVRPQDQLGIDNMEDRALALEEQLFQLSQQFTAEYMALDPKIVGINNNLESINQKIVQRRNASRQTYLNEMQQAVRAGNLKEATLRDQLAIQQERAQTFSHRLSEYESMTLDLEQIRQQAQTIRDQIIEAEVRKPFEASIDILEPPLQPGFPIGPNYGRDSAVVLVLASLLSLLVLSIYALINRQHRPGVILSTFAVNQSAQPAPPEQLSATTRTQIGYQPASPLTEEECRILIAGAPLHCRLALHLMLSGVAANELLRLNTGNFDVSTAELEIDGQYPRRLTLHESVIETFRQAINGGESGMWSAPSGDQLTLEELELMLEHTAEEARLERLETVRFKDIRMTYLLFLARQGGKLSDMERIAGYLSTDDVSRCRELAGNSKPATTGNLKTIHPALATL